MDTRLLTAIALLAVSCGLQAATDHPLVAHEWGTFTSVQGGDGVQISWIPSIGTDLPGFVYSRAVRNGGISGVTLLDTGVKGSLSGYVRMETPVIYFYSEAERVVDVRVLFPMGRITEWYPQATSVGPYMIGNEASPSAIEWNGVRVLSQDTQHIAANTLIRGREDSQANHYYAARATDANFLCVASVHAQGKAEFERDLFYRGVGFFTAPLTVQLDAGERQLTLSTGSAEPLSSVFVLTIRQGMMRYQKIDQLTAQAGAAIELDVQPFNVLGDALGDARERIMHDVILALVQQGLYEKEARAMVDTWKDQWFAEEGTRVLYLLPRTWTDQALPLEISPRPDSTVRVMVGRAELITPSLERELKKQITAYGAGNPAAKRQAVTAARSLGLGRFFAPATQKALGNNPPPALAQAAWRLTAEASEPGTTGL
jgi:hypothetical protein